MRKNSVFKSEAGKKKLLDRYNEIVSCFPVKKRYVETSFGKTFLLEAGEAKNPAVILLHGSCGNSAFWLGDILALSERFYVFAVDIIGEAGNSEENRQDPTLEAYALWLKEVMDQLGLTQVMMIGNSLGGYLALKFAVTYPKRTAKLALIASSGIVPASKAFLFQSTDAVREGKEGIKALNETVVGEAAMPQEVLDFMNLILENFNPMTDALPVYTDEQLCRLTMPVFFIAGAQDNTMDAACAVKRLLKAVPYAQAYLIENGAHVVVGAMEMIIPFLTKEEE